MLLILFTFAGISMITFKEKPVRWSIESCAILSFALLANINELVGC